MEFQRSEEVIELIEKQTNVCCLPLCFVLSNCLTESLRFAQCYGSGSHAWCLPVRAELPRTFIGRVPYMMHHMPGLI